MASILAAKGPYLTQPCFRANPALTKSRLSGLTRRQLQLRSVRQDTDGQSEDERLLLRDLERLRTRQQTDLRSTPGSRATDQQDVSTSAAESAKDILDKVLIADFFFVCAALAWLVAGVAFKASFDNSTLLDAWYPLWQWVFQPAIGVLMLGALVSGAVGKLQQKN